MIVFHFYHQEKLNSALLITASTIQQIRNLAGFEGIGTRSQFYNKLHVQTTLAKQPEYIEIYGFRSDSQNIGKMSQNASNITVTHYTCMSFNTFMPYQLEP